MPTITIYLDNEMYARLLEESKKTKRGVSGIIQDALEEE